MPARDRIPEYLTGRYQLTATVIFTALFSLVLILLMTPYSRESWFSLGLSDKSSLLTLAFMLFALMILALSKKILYEYARRHPVSVGGYVFWCIAEVVLVSLTYSFFSLNGCRAGVIELENTGFPAIFISALWFSLFSLGVPYIVAALYFTLEERNNTIRLMSFSSITTDEAPSVVKDKKITLYDNSGSLKLVVSASNLYYIESDDNYIKVWYQDASGALKQYMLRCRLKTVEESFADSDLVRCHRKYIVNFAKVEVLTRVKDGYTLDLGLEKLAPIPVSKTYEENVLARFNSR